VVQERVAGLCFASKLAVIVIGVELSCAYWENRTEVSYWHRVERELSALGAAVQGHATINQICHRVGGRGGGHENKERRYSSSKSRREIEGGGRREENEENGHTNRSHKEYDICMVAAEGAVLILTYDDAEGSSRAW